MAEYRFGLFEEDVILPVQFYAAFRGGSKIQPERRLMLAVLRETLEDIQKYVFAIDRHGQGLFLEAQAWIDSEEGDWPFSFENICEATGINPEYLRRGVRGWLEQTRAGPPSPDPLDIPNQPTGT